MANTANELARDVGLEIGIIDAVSDLEADQLDDLKNISRRKHAEWRSSPVAFCYWDENEIPDEVYEPLKLCLAAYAGKMFGKSIRDDPLSEAQTRDARLAALKAASAMHYAGSVAKAEYF